MEIFSVILSVFILFLVLSVQKELSKVSDRIEEVESSLEEEIKNSCPHNQDEELLG
ncbi:hypothetical protein ACFL16_00135 [Patescibacteria group bacterium]